jgi:hypothetical protein
MSKITRCLFMQISCCLLLYLTSGAAIGSENKVTLKKGEPLVIRIPRKLLKYEHYSLMSGLPIFTVGVSMAGEAIVVDGISDWQTRGWPSMLTLFYEKSSKKKEYIEIECRSSLAYIKIRFSPNTPDVNAAFRQIIFLGSSEAFESSAEFNALAEKLLPNTFPGVLAQIPRDKQLRLLKEIGYNDEGMGVEEFKGKQYIAFSAGDPTSVFNSLQVNQTARVATVLKGLALPAFKKVAPIITDANGIYGIKIRVRIFYRDFLTEQYLQPHVEMLEIFAPYDLVEKFFNLDITNQKLVDGSFVLIDGNRIEVDLSKAAQI